MKILAIETSCDDTSIALVEARGGLRKPQFKVIENIVSSQIKIHAQFGGVVPNLAKREHIQNLPIVLKEVLNISTSDVDSIDMIAVTVGPGLEPALWTGIEFAKELAKKIDVPLIGSNHLEGHLYSTWLGLKKERPRFPAAALIVSGGHTILLKMDSLTKWKKLGETRDDAAGEAFDKVGRMLGLSYPAGPEIERLARQGNPHAIAFPRPMLKDKSYDFSFSGLKTAVLYYLRDYDKKEIAKAGFLPNAVASFQEAAIDVLVQKTMRAVEEHGAKSVLLCGGVSANTALQSALKKESAKRDATFFVPPRAYNTDNAAMIAAAAYIQHLRGIRRRMIANAGLNM